MPNLPEQLIGKKIVHISDLHCSRTVSGKYLRDCVRRVNDIGADMVVMTGDYVTHDFYGAFRSRAIDIISEIESKYGTYACLGNHDYGVGSVIYKKKNGIAGYLADGFRDSGIQLLVNDSAVVDVDGGKLRFVGVGDVWAGDCEPGRAFDGVGADEAVIVLAHNPEAVEHIDGHLAEVVMCGHTHGSKVDFVFKPNGWFINKRFHYAGMYEVGDRKMYVNRGLGRLGRMLYNSRPEITVYELDRC